MLFVIARVLFFGGIVVAVLYGACLVVMKLWQRDAAKPEKPQHPRPSMATGQGLTAKQAPKPQIAEPPAPVDPATTIADIWALAALKMPDKPSTWLYARKNRNLRLTVIGQFLYIEQVDGDEYADRKRGTTLRATVFIIERSKRMALVCDVPLPVADSIEREVELAHKVIESVAPRGKIAASDDALRKLQLDLNSAEDLSAHD